MLAHVLDVCSGESVSVIVNKQCWSEMKALTFLRIHLSDISRLELVLAQHCLFLDSLLVTLSKTDQLLHTIDVVLALIVEVVHLQCLGPYLLVQVHQHVLLKPCLAVVDSDAVVVTVQAVDEGLNRRLIQMTQVGCCLPGLLAHDDGLGLNESEGINDDLALDGLNGVNDNSDSTRCKLFE